MPLREKISDEDLALLEIVECPVLLGEFLRNTNNGEMDRKLWPKTPFKYRSYQRDILTDRSPYISVVAGRAVGKCQSLRSNVYTTKGYKTIKELLELPSFDLYALDVNGNIVIRRGKVYPDKKDKVYKVVTESGREVVTTLQHPFLTRSGWRQLKDLREGDHIAVATALPEIQGVNTFEWHELRYLGYRLLSRDPGPESEIKLRFRRQVAEMRLIAKKFKCNCIVSTDRRVKFIRKYFFKKNDISWLLQEVDITNTRNGFRVFPHRLSELPNDSLKVMLEALFSTYAALSLTGVSLEGLYRDVAYTLQEMLLRFRIESKIERIGETKPANYKLSLLDTRAVYRFFTTFDLPGVAIESIPLPPPDADESEHLRFEPIKSIALESALSQTYAVYVYQDHNYISGNIYVHNSLVLEDKIVHTVINSDVETPITREQVIATANQSQLNPILDRLITRFSAGKLLKSFLNNQVNKSQGVLKFAPVQAMLTARIAGSKGENNMIGLHIPRIIIDEGQVFGMPSYTQLMPTLNSWEPKTQVLITGVPNGLRNSALYFADQKFAKYKKYRIPSHNNPYYSRQADLEAVKKAGGEQSDEYQNLVLGRHGNATEQVLSPDSIKRESFDFYSYRYSSFNYNRGETIEEIFSRPRLPETVKEVVACIDTGFIDPTVINVVGRDSKGIWRTYIRYRMQRVAFPEQERIIDWLDDVYLFDRIGIDIGAGGGGSGILQGLQSRNEYKHKHFNKRATGYSNGESIIIGKNEETGSDIKKDSKSIGTEEIVRLIEDGNLVFSELDSEGTSELERIGKQKALNGADRYFVQSENGKTKSTQDHIYAAYIVFGLMVRVDGKRKKKKLAKSFMA